LPFGPKDVRIRQLDYDSRYANRSERPAIISPAHWATRFALGGYAMPAALKENIAPAYGQMETRLWLQLLSLHGELFASLNSILSLEFGLSLAKFDVLAQLDRYPDGLTLGQLSQNLKVSGGNVSGLVQRLLADDLISKEMSREDRRSFIVRLTSKGEALFRKAADVHKKHLSKRLENVSAKELDTALTVLRSLSSKLQTEKKKSRKR
jgi:DNA-binding MarR family transcriptional regulator